MKLWLPERSPVSHSVSDCQAGSFWSRFPLPALSCKYQRRAAVYTERPSSMSRAAPDTVPRPADAIWQQP